MRYDIFGRLDYGVNAYDSWQLYSANENAEYNLKAQNSFIDDTDVDYEDQIYDESSSYYLPHLTINLLQTFENCDKSLRFDSMNQVRMIKDSFTSGNSSMIDDKDGFMKMKKLTVIHSQNNLFYRVLKLLGKGTFGSVFVCREIQSEIFYAVKVICSKTEYFLQGQNEMRMLTWINDVDHDDKLNFVHLTDYECLYHHHCFITPLYQFTLFQLIRANVQGLKFYQISAISKILLYSLEFLHRHGVIHTDIKPENILFEGMGSDLDKYKLRLIDMGSCVNSTPIPIQYCQSLLYRSPEVLLHEPYTTAIDIWSLGVVLFSCCLNKDFFLCSTDLEALYCINQRVGNFPSSLVLASQSSRSLFVKNSDNQFCVKKPDNCSIKLTSYKDEIWNKKFQVDLSPSQKEYECEERRLFIDFLSYMLVLDPSKRHSASQLLQHPFVTRRNEPYAPIGSAMVVSKDSPKLTNFFSTSTPINRFCLPFTENQPSRRETKRNRHPAYYSANSTAQSNQNTFFSTQTHMSSYQTREMNNRDTGNSYFSQPSYYR